MNGAHNFPLRGSYVICIYQVARFELACGSRVPEGLLQNVISSVEHLLPDTEVLGKCALSSCFKGKMPKCGTNKQTNSVALIPRANYTD
jgi:hypothetical protein